MSISMGINLATGKDMITGKPLCRECNKPMYSERPKLRVCSDCYAKEKEKNEKLQKN